MSVHLLARIGLFVVGLGVLAIGLDTIRGDELVDRFDRIQGGVVVAFALGIFAFAWFVGGAP